MKARARDALDTRKGSGRGFARGREMGNCENGSEKDGGVREDESNGDDSRKQD